MHVSAGARVASVRAADGDRPPEVHLANGLLGFQVEGVNRLCRCARGERAPANSDRPPLVHLAGGLGFKNKAVNASAGARVASVRAADGDRPPTVHLAGGGEAAAPRGVVVATEAPEAAALLGGALADAPSKREHGVGTACVYFRRACPWLSKGFCSVRRFEFAGWCMTLHCSDHCAKGDARGSHAGCL